MKLLLHLNHYTTCLLRMARVAEPQQSFYPINQLILSCHGRWTPIEVQLQTMRKTQLAFIRAIVIYAHKLREDATPLLQASHSSIPICRVYYVPSDITQLMLLPLCMVQKEAVTWKTRSIAIEEVYSRLISSPPFEDHQSRVIPRHVCPDTPVCHTLPLPVLR